MGLPALYYDGRNDPPHPEIWANYFLRMVELYSAKVVLSVSSEATKAGEASFSYLSPKEKDFLSYLFKTNIKIFKPIELAKPLKVSARTIANWSAALAKNGFLRPNLVKKRITFYSLTDLANGMFFDFS
jgi:DNA-binding MarR family transcriptional regulator